MTNERAAVTNKNKTRILARVADEDTAYRRARDRRRVLILEAVREGVPVTEVAAAAGVTRDAVYKLAQASRKADG
jgi:hypothetical protein